MSESIVLEESQRIVQVHKPRSNHSAPTGDNNESQPQLLLQQQQIHPLKEISFGAISGMFGKLIEFPFDTIKVRLQAATPSESVSPSTLSMIKSTYRNEGIINGFYKGLKAPLIGACIETGILFSSYNFAVTELSKNLDKKDENSASSLAIKCVSGGFAGFMASFVLTPIELIKCQLQVSNLVATNATTAKKAVGVSYIPLIQSIIKKNGVTGLWNGLSSTLIREIFGTAVWFGTYEYVSQAKVLNINNDLNSLLSGAVAGLTFNLSIFPIDTIKSNIQTFEMLNKGTQSKNGKHAQNPVDFLNITKSLITRNGGIRNLYNGLGITLIRCVPANAIIFYSYEVLKRNF